MKSKPPNFKQFLVRKKYSLSLTLFKRRFLNLNFVTNFFAKLARARFIEELTYSDSKRTFSSTTLTVIILGVASVTLGHTTGVSASYFHSYRALVRHLIRILVSEGLRLVLALTVVGRRVAGYWHSLRGHWRRCRRVMAMTSHQVRSDHTVIDGCRWTEFYVGVLCID